ncbi:MAG TPA: hypothetical protein IAC28_01085 [Candidatus Aphodovivens excrementavium]|nr:hypothetical protein [Candidatus Aphodovivens excrementavium]
MCCEFGEQSRAAGLMAVRFWSAASMQAGSKLAKAEGLEYEAGKLEYEDGCCSYRSKT